MNPANSQYYAPPGGVAHDTFRHTLNLNRKVQPVMKRHEQSPQIFSKKGDVRMKKLLSLLLALILIANSSLPVLAHEEDPDCTCNCEDCTTEECECPCHEPDPNLGPEWGGDGDDYIPKG